MKCMVLGGALALMVAGCGGAQTAQVRVSPPGAAQCAPVSAQDVAQAVSSTSELRARSGAVPVVAQGDLSRIAAQQACHMASTGVMTHTGPRGEGPMQRAQAVGYAPSIIAENVAAGQRDVAQALASWEASGGHRANATLLPVREMGIGHAVGADGRHYWAAVYAAR